MRPRNLIYVAIALLMFFLPYGVARATGYWSTSGKFDGKGQPSPPPGGTRPRSRGG